MALCNRCGAVLNNDDVFAGNKHICDPLDIPAPGTIKKAITKDVIIQSK